MTKKIKFTAKDKKYVVQASFCVHSVVSEVQRLILKKLKGRTPYETFALYGRIVIMLVQNHFGLTLKSAHECQAENDAHAQQIQESSE